MKWWNKCSYLFYYRYIQSFLYKDSTIWLVLSKINIYLKAADHAGLTPLLQNWLIKLIENSWQTILSLSLSYQYNILLTATQVHHAQEASMFTIFISGSSKIAFLMKHNIYLIKHLLTKHAKKIWYKEILSRYKDTKFWRVMTTLNMN